MRAWAGLAVLWTAALAAQSPAAAPRPQDDLFGFVNHAWLEATPIPDDRVAYSAASELADRVEAQTRDLIEALQAQPGRGRHPDAQRVVDLYQSVLDTETVERLGLEPVRADLARFDDVKDARDVATLAGYLSSIAAGGLFDVRLSIDRGGVTATIQPGGLLLPDPSYYLEPTRQMLEVRREYGRYLAEIFTAAGLPRDVAERNAGLSIRLETELAALIPRAPRLASPVRWSLDQLERGAPGFDWEAWGKPQGLQRARAIVLAGPDFFGGFADLMARTPPTVIAGWLRGRYLTAMAPYLPRAFSNARFEFFGRRLTGQVAPRPLWKRGVSLVNEYLGDAVGREYVARHLRPADRQQARAVIEAIVKEARRSVGDSAWMSGADRAAVLRRLDMLRIEIGGPDDWQSYGGLEIRPDDHLGNVRRLRQFQARLRLANARIRDTAWSVGAQSVNAFYAPRDRAIVVPAGILQPPYFDAGASVAANFGALGAVAGHEVTHALELPALASRAVALLDQFAAYETVPGVRLNGQLTFAENVADLAGLQLAYSAYRRSLGEGVPDDPAFFSGWATMWRGKARSDYARYANETSPHAPPRFRANGAVSHLDAFHAAFGVSMGDSLFRPPGERIRVW